MIGKQDLNNVRAIMYKEKNLADNEQDKERFENLIKSFNDVANRYLKEVRQNVRLQ